MGSQGRFLASHICDAIRPAFDRSKAGVESRERDARAQGRLACRASLSCHSACLFCGLFSRLSVFCPTLSIVLFPPWGCAVFLLLRRVPGSRSGSSLWGLHGYPPGYTLRLGIKSGSQWRRSTSYLKITRTTLTSLRRARRAPRRRPPHAAGKTETSIIEDPASCLCRWGPFLLPFGMSALHLELFRQSFNDRISNSTHSPPKL